MIVTFYSYKGGVGRSMALANVAVWFRQQGLRVVMIDWDLEAPGLESFFADDDAERNAFRAKVGLVDLIGMYKDVFVNLPRPTRSGTGGVTPGRERISELVATLNDGLPPITHTLIPIRTASTATNGGKLWLLPAGCRADARFDGYARTVQQFDWEEFYAKFEGEAYFEWMRQQLLQPEVADIVLIDSRTGVAEMSGVCTRQLADIVVLFCAPNDQNLEGLATMARSFTRADLLQARGGRPIELLPVPARVDVSEGRPIDLFDERFRQTLEPFAPKMFRQLPNPRNRLRIPYISAYAYAERLAIGDPEGVKSLQQAYVTLAAHVVALASADSAIKRHCRAALQDTFGLPTVFVTSLDEAGARFASELRLRLDRAGVVALHARDKPEVALESARADRSSSSGSAAVVLAGTATGLLGGTRVRDLARRAREQGVSLLAVTEGPAAGSTPRPIWARRLPFYDVDADWDELVRVLQSAVRPPRIPFMAPPVRPHFVNRSTEIGRLKSLLLGRDDRARSIAIVGLDGMGKTALARALCNDDEIGDAFEDGILWMTLGAQPDLLKAAGAALAAFGEDIRTIAHLEEAERRLAEHLANKRCLIVVDDLTDSGHLRLISGRDPACQVLMTTRARDIAAETGATIFELGPLDGAEGRKWIAGEKADRKSVEVLAAKLGNVPLALELAEQALRRGLAPADLVRRLEMEGLTALDAGTSRDAATSLFASFMLAVERLPHDDRARLPALAQLRPGEPIELSEVARLTETSRSEVEPLLQRLAATSLIDFDATHRTVTVSEPVSAFLRSLKLRQERAEAVRRTSPRPRGPTVGISYRREDTGAAAGRIYDRLTERFGYDRVFLDIDSIPPGMDFVDTVERRIASASALVVIIGRNWIGSSDEAGRPRLEETADFVRVEIEVALKHAVPIIPVLVEGAAMPQSEDLPESLHALTRRQAFEVTDLRFQHDLDQLVRAIEQLTEASPTEPVTHLSAKARSARRAPTFAVLGIAASIILVVIGVLQFSPAERVPEPITKPPVTSTSGSAPTNTPGAGSSAPPATDQPVMASPRAQSLFDRAEAHYFGRGVPQDYSEAAKLYRQAAEMGFAPAQNGLGRMYEDGAGVSKDFTKAIYWYRLAATAGHPDAQAALRRLDSRRR